MGSTTHTSNVLSDIEKIRKAKEEFKQLIQTIGTNALRQELDKTLRLLGTTKIKWAQYTPYFNDGDPCEFGVRGLYYFLQEGASEDEVEDEDDYGKWVYLWARSTASDDLKEAAKIESIMMELEEVLLAAFGDHVEVIYDGVSFTVEDYNHD